MKRVIISDTHLGQTGQDGMGQVSLLSRVPTNHLFHRKSVQKINSLASEIDRFAEGQPVNLTVNGDLLDLSLSTIQDCLDSLVYLLGYLPQVTELNYVVGNHDHHMWMMHSEYKRVIQPLEWGDLPSPAPYRSTALYGDPSHLLDKLFLRNTGRVISTRLIYPCLYLPQQSLYLTHGHLFGGIYTLISRILKPYIQTSCEDPIATTNLALTEFIYWLMGETGEGMGVDGIMEAIYTDIEKGKDSELKKVLSSAVDALFPNGLVNWIPDKWERGILKWLSKKIAINITKGKGNAMTSSARYQSIEDTRKEAVGWVKRTAALPLANTLTMAIGHTHIADQYKIPESNITLYNTGSWLAETEHPDPDSYVLLLESGKQPVFKKVE